MVTREKEQSSVSWDPFRCVGRALALLQTQAGRARHATFDQMAPVEYHSYPQPSVKPEVGSIDAAFFQMHSVPASDSFETVGVIAASVCFSAVKRSVEVGSWWFVYVRLPDTNV